MRNSENRGSLHFNWIELNCDRFNYMIIYSFRSLPLYTHFRNVNNAISNTNQCRKILFTCFRFASCLFSGSNIFFPIQMWKNHQVNRTTEWDFVVLKCSAWGFKSALFTVQNWGWFQFSVDLCQYRTLGDILLSMIIARAREKKSEKSVESQWKSKQKQRSNIFLEYIIDVRFENVSVILTIH